MGKIPQIPLTDRPSAVPGDIGAAGITDAPTQTFQALAGLAESSLKILGIKQKAEAKKRQEAKEAKQAIVDEIEAGRRAGDFEVDVLALLANLQDDFKDEPLDALPEFLEVARRNASQAIADAPNADVALQLARATNTRISVGARAIDAWAQGRQSQKARADLDVMMNQVSRGAEGLLSPGQLSEYLMLKEAELAPLAGNIHGEGAEAKLLEMKTDATKAWLSVFGRTNALEALSAIDAVKGPQVDFLSGAERKTARREILQNLDGFGKARDMERLKSGLGRKRELFDSFRRDDLNAGMLLSTERALEAEIKAGKIDPTLQSEQRDILVSRAEEELEYTKAMGRAWRRGANFDATDDPVVRAQLLRTQEEVVDKRWTGTSVDLSLWTKQETAVLVAFGNKEIGRATYGALMEELVQALPQGLEDESANTWTFNPFDWRNPRQAGNNAINDAIASGEFAGLDEVSISRARIEYIRALNRTVQKGGVLTDQGAIRMALRALSGEAGEAIPGAFDVQP